MTDSTRVLTYAINGWSGNSGLPGVSQGYHVLTHHGMDPSRLKELTVVETYHAAQFARFIEELKTNGLYKKTWQAFAVLLPIQTVGVMGDQRTYENVIGLRAVTSVDGMTADWAQLPHDFLAKVSNRIINEVKGVNRVVYDVSSKPPSTIEWE